MKDSGLLRSPSKPTELLRKPETKKVLGPKPSEVGLPPYERWGERIAQPTSCESCEYLKDAAKMICGNEDFIAWNGGSNHIPAPTPKDYCSIWWEANDEVEDS